MDSCILYHMGLNERQPANTDSCLSFLYNVQRHLFSGPVLLSLYTEKTNTAFKKCNYVDIWAEADPLKMFGVGL